MAIEIQPVTHELKITKHSYAISPVAGRNTVNIISQQNAVTVEHAANDFRFVADSDSPELQVEDTTRELTITPGENIIEAQRCGAELGVVGQNLEPVFQRGVHNLTISLGTAIRGTTEAFTNVEFYAMCSVDEAVGDPVYIFAPPILGTYIVRKVDITDRVKMPAIGVVKEKFTDTSCRILVCGILEGAYSGLAPGYMLYAGRYGGLVHSSDLPDPLVTRHYAQIIGQAASDTDAVIQINPTPCWRLG